MQTVHLWRARSFGHLFVLTLPAPGDAFANGCAVFSAVTPFAFTMKIVEFVIDTAIAT